MEVRDAGEALYIACEMEKRAIRLYERALIVFGDGDCRQAIGQILSDERNHLAQFSALGAEAPGFERAQVLAAQAADVLFSGGLMEAQRKGAFASPEALFAYAAAEEAGAVERYGQFAKQLTGSAGEAFAAISLEEKGHYAKLSYLAGQEK
ncbi:MAG: hypothetical protein E7324_05065 [Clostridiales bacterium]|nr:hypothetical protein [Clostridiales bacterium]